MKVCAKQFPCQKKAQEHGWVLESNAALGNGSQRAALVVRGDLSCKVWCL